MRLEITRVEGLRNDLLLRIDRPEIETVTLSVANRAQLMTLPGMPRHREAGPEEVQGIADAKVPIEEHLRWLGVVDDTGKARQRAIAISNRNLGTNHGHVAWQRDEQPPIVRIGEDPFAGRPRSCLTVRAGGRLAIEDLTFDAREQRIQAVDGTAGDATTLRPWSSGHAQQPGRWVQIELPQPAMIAGVLSESPAAIVDTTPAVPGAPTRTGIGGRGGGAPLQAGFPRGYEVVVSNDGTTWGNPLAQGQGKGVVNEISVEPTRAKFVRIRTGTAADAPWTLRRLRVLEVPAQGGTGFWGGQPLEVSTRG